MIDPLIAAALPQPIRSGARDAQPGTPSFLEWTLAHPGTPPNPEGGPGQGGDDGLSASLPQTPDPAPAIPMAAIPMAAIVESVATTTSAAMPPPVQLDAIAANPVTLSGPIAPSPLPQGQTAAGTPAIDVVERRTQDPSPMVATVFGAADPRHGDERLAATLAFHVRKPGGEREVVALPWRLMASGRLAQSRAGGVALASPGATGDATVAPSSPVASPGALRADAPGHAGSDGVGSTRAETPLALLPSSTRETRDAGRSAPATVGMASSPVAAEWMARWIKWIERDGHDPVLWLRDYRIDDAETRRVVDALRGLAREQGISLERIVVNGREFWRSPDHEPNRSKE